MAKERMEYEVRKKLTHTRSLDINRLLAILRLDVAFILLLLSTSILVEPIYLQVGANIVTTLSTL